jgi:hypothetical protein
MIIYNFDCGGPFRCPNKTHPEPGIDPDRVLSLAVAHQRLEPIAWRRPQIVEIVRGVKVAQFPTRYLDQISGKSFRSFAIENSFSGLIAEAPDTLAVYHQMIHQSMTVSVYDTQAENEQNNWPSKKPDI